VRRNLRRAAVGGSERRPIREAPIITGKSGGIGRRLVFILLLFAGIGLAIGQSAYAEPPAITKAKNEAEALREQVDELSHQLDAAVEDYNYAKATLAETKEAIEKTQLQLTKAEADLEVAGGSLTERLVEIYKEGQLGMLDTLMGSASFSELVNRLDMMERLSEQDAKLVAEVKAYQEDVSARKSELAEQLEAEKTLTADAKAAKLKVEDQLAANEKALAGKEAQVAQLEKEEAARQAKLAAEAKRRAEEAKKKAAQEAAAKAKQQAASLNTSKGVKASVPESASPSDVVSIAMEYLGSRMCGPGRARAASTAPVSCCTCTRRWVSICPIRAACSTGMGGLCRAVSLGPVTWCSSTAPSVTWASTSGTGR